MRSTLCAISGIIAFGSNTAFAFVSPVVGPLSSNLQRLDEESSPFAAANRNTHAPSTGSSSMIMQSNKSKDAIVETTEKPIRLVWLTGWGDMRTHDHGGFIEAMAAAANTNELVVPVFIIDPRMHLRSRSPSCLRRLHASLSSLERDILSLSSSSSLSPLVVRTGSASWVLPALAEEIHASACHVIADDVVSTRKKVQRSACDALREMDIDVIRWENSLRPTAPWAEKKRDLPSFYPDYCKIADSLPTTSPLQQNHFELDETASSTFTSTPTVAVVESNGVPSLKEFIRMGEAQTPDAVLRARSSRPEISTTEPYDDLVARWSTEATSRNAIEEYISLGKNDFANKHLIASDAANIGSTLMPYRPNKSLYASAAARILKNKNKPSDVLALREAPTKAFSSALSLGSLSARDVVDAARNRSPVTPPLLWSDTKPSKNNDHDRNNNRAGLFPSDDPLWDRSSEGSLSDVVEWREWFHLLAERSLELQEMGESATSGGEKESSSNERGDPREAGTVAYWRWKGQHLVRYMTWPAGEDYYKEENAAARKPAMLLVHGFAASVEQWERLVYSLRKQTVSADGKDTTPPIFAVDLLGFGHSEKPGLTYTQYLWESQIVDFALEVMEATPMVLVGNSIGGGLSAGAASSLGSDICRGLVLCNTAGELYDPSTYTGYNPDPENEIPTAKPISSYTEAAMEGNPNEGPYVPVPVIGNKALDLFGWAVIKAIYPQIDKRLSLIYGNRIQNADPAVSYAIQQSAVGPGSANVIGSGQKLSVNRPLNEVLLEGFPTLVVMGLEDKVSSPVVAKSRAEIFSRLSPENIAVESIMGAGHCPHDEVPDKVAAAMLKWLSSSAFSEMAQTTTLRKETAEAKAAAEAKYATGAVTDSEAKVAADDEAKAAADIEAEAAASLQAEEEAKAAADAEVKAAATADIEAKAAASLQAEEEAKAAADAEVKAAATADIEAKAAASLQAEKEAKAAADAATADIEAKAAASLQAEEEAKAAADAEVKAAATAAATADIEAKAAASLQAEEEAKAAADEITRAVTEAEDRATTAEVEAQALDLESKDTGDVEAKMAAESKTTADATADAEAMAEGEVKVAASAEAKEATEAKAVAEAKAAAEVEAEADERRQQKQK